MRAKLFNGDCAEVLAKIAPDKIDLTVTSPPYDNLRDYHGYSFDFEAIARQLYRVTKPGGVVVWVVNDATIKGSETCSSFKQALYFKEIGFRLHDTMIWVKAGCPFPETTRYYPLFEYMFVLSKGRPRVSNLLADKKNKLSGGSVCGAGRQKDGTMRLSNGAKVGRKVKEYGVRYNVWKIPNPGRAGEKHPATFPLRLARDHIRTWSNPGDIVLDPFLGSGTTGAAALSLGRKFVGIEISPEYLKLASEKLAEYEVCYG